MNAAASHADLTVAAWPGLTPRLLIEAETTEVRVGDAFLDRLAAL